MPRLLSILAATAVLAGCTTYKLWKESDADQQLGIVHLSYSYGKYENPQVDERAGIGMARERCAGWGFRDAVRRGEDRQCLEGVQTACSKWQVTREYECLKEPNKY